MVAWTKFLIMKSRSGFISKFSLVEQKTGVTLLLFLWINVIRLADSRKWGYSNFRYAEKIIYHLKNTALYFILYFSLWFFLLHVCYPHFLALKCVSDGVINIRPSTFSSAELLRCVLLFAVGETSKLLGLQFTCTHLNYLPDSANWAKISSWGFQALPLLIRLRTRSPVAP